MGVTFYQGYSGEILDHTIREDVLWSVDHAAHMSPPCYYPHIAKLAIISPSTTPHIQTWRVRRIHSFTMIMIVHLIIVILSSTQTETKLYQTSIISLLFVFKTRGKHLHLMVYIYVNCVAA